MNNNRVSVPFGKAFLTALFSGILATMVCFVFEIWYRFATSYGPSDYINVSSIIFIVNLLLLVAGVSYYAFKTWFKKGDWIYVICSVLTTIFCMWMIAGIHRFTDLKLNREFIQLLGGITLIIGIAALCIPFFYNNKNILDLYYDAEV
jgi:uncharacterized membrane protein HdeD (DUF308 family)